MADVNPTVKAILDKLSTTNLKQIHQSKIGDSGKNNQIRIDNLSKSRWSEQEVNDLKTKLRDQIEAQKPWMARIASIDGCVSKDNVFSAMQSWSAVFNNADLTEEGFYNVQINDDVLTCQYWMKLEIAIVGDGPDGILVKTVPTQEMVKIRIDFQKELIFIEEKDWWKAQRGIKVLRAVGVNCGNAGLSGVESSIANTKVKSMIDELQQRLQGVDQCHH